MTLKGNIIDIELKSSDLSDKEKEIILFEAFDILLSESDSTKTIKDNDKLL